jgi:hypothetical protein
LISNVVAFYLSLNCCSLWRPVLLTLVEHGSSDFLPIFPSSKYSIYRLSFDFEVSLSAFFPVFVTSFWLLLCRLWHFIQVEFSALNW